MEESTEKPTQIHVLIIGSGLAGLAAALALNQAGHRITVIERTPKHVQVGAGIQISPNGTRVLRSLGVLDSVLEHAYHPRGGGTRSWRDGSKLSSLGLSSTDTEEIYKGPYIVVHRADLHNALVSAAEDRGVSIRLGCSITQLDLSERTAVILSDGERVEGHVILGADGERSFCRTALLGRHDPPLPTGDIVYRIALSRGDILADDAHPSRELMQPGSVNLWLGPGAHVVSYPLNNNNILNIVLIRKDDTQRPEDIMYGQQPASLEEVRSLFDNWDPALRALLDVPGETNCAKWNMVQMKTVDHWRHQPSGRLCLIGDSAHAMPPYLAQGASQAFEDAAVLGAVFARVRDVTQIPEALEIFEAVRKPRTDMVRQRSVARKDFYEIHDGPEQRDRDQKLALYPGKGSPDDLANPETRQWLWGYDAAADGARAAQRMESKDDGK